MPSKAKIKILDPDPLRTVIDQLYQKTNQVDLAKWSLSIAKHVFTLAKIDYRLIRSVIEGFQINELWQLGEVSVHHLRQSAFKIHKLARECENEMHQTALRVAGHAVASGHMAEHALIAADYAIKAVGILTSNNLAAITREREWQLNELKRISQHMTKD